MNRQPKNRQLKHREISRQLRAEITTGKFAPAGRLPAEKQLVERFRVSRPTVARALRDLQDEGLVERRAGSGTWQRNPAARSARVRQLGLLIPNLGTTDIFEVIGGELSALARTHDYSLPGGNDATVSTASRELSPAQALKLCDQFIELSVAGVFFAPFAELSNRDEINQRIAERFVKAGITVVLLDRDLLPFPRRSNFDLVGVDNLAGGCLLAEHLIKLGCRRVAFAVWPHQSPTINARIAGVREALAGHRLEAPPDWVHAGNP